LFILGFMIILTLFLVKKSNKMFKKYYQIKNGGREKDTNRCQMFCIMDCFRSNEISKSK